MKSLLSLFLACTLLAAPAPQGPPGEFATKFRQAEKLNAREEIAKLVKRYPLDATQFVHGVCIAIMNGTSEELENQAEALRKGWNDSFNSRFVEHIYNYYSLMQLRPQERGQWLKLKQTYDLTNRKYVKLLNEAKGSSQFLAIGQDMRGLAEAFEQLGDKYMAGLAYLQAGTAYDEGCAGDNADFEKAADCYELGVPRYDEVDLKDQLYNICRERIPVLRKSGFGKADSGATPTGGSTDTTGGSKPPTDGGPAPLVPGVTLGTPTEVPMTFEIVPEIGTFGRPIYGNDEVYPVWTQLSLRKVGTSVRIPAMQSLPVEFLRTGSSKVFVDQDGDREPDVEVPLKGKIAPIELTLGGGADERQWGLLVVTGGETDTYQQIEMNLAPSDEYMNLYVAPAGSMVGTLDKIRIQVIDENMDGFYGGLHTAWAHLGLVQGYTQPEFDSVLIDGEKSARPWSEYQKVGPTWYRLEAKGPGTTLVATPAELPSGTLRLDFDGGEPLWLVVRGEGKYAASYFDLAPGGTKGIEVPAGKYELYAGLWAKGKRRQVMKALILPGKGMQKWVVEAGGVTTVELGEPFGFAFDYDRTREHVTVRGKTVCITGKAGERYERPWACVPQPEVSIREKGEKRGSKPEEMDAINDQETLITQGFVSAWFPFDLVLDNENPDADIELQLTEKKNKMFGQITSDWK